MSIYSCVSCFKQNRYANKISRRLRSSHDETIINKNIFIDTAMNLTKDWVNVMNNPDVQLAAKKTAWLQSIEQNDSR